MIVVKGDSNLVNARAPGVLNLSCSGLGYNSIRNYEVVSDMENHDPAITVFALGVNDVFKKEHDEALDKLAQIFLEAKTYSNVYAAGCIDIDQEKLPDTTPIVTFNCLLRGACADHGVTYIPKFKNPIFRNVDYDGIHITNRVEYLRYLVQFALHHHHSLGL